VSGPCAMPGRRPVSHPPSPEGAAATGEEQPDEPIPTRAGASIASWGKAFQSLFSPRPPQPKPEQGDFPETLARIRRELPEPRQIGSGPPPPLTSRASAQTMEQLKLKLKSIEDRLARLP